MLTPSDAEKIIQSKLLALPAEDCPLAHAHGRVLRAAIAADRDLPPFDRVTADGYAVKLGGNRAREFRVAGFQAAGMIPLPLQSDGECVEVAAGAALPPGADAVVPREDAVRAENCIQISDTTSPVAGQCVRRRGSEHRRGEVVCGAGARVGSREIAAAAACGYAHLRVSVPPRIAIVTTGDELVEISNPSPAPHQIRRSNDYALSAALREAGYFHAECICLRDVEHEMEKLLRRIIAEHDVVITTGGVSKGPLDLLPGVLAKLDVEKIFQGVAQKPGRSFWFGLTKKRTPVFALPGNPVSTHVCLRRYVIPALARMSGSAPAQERFATLAEGFDASPQLAHHVLVRIEETASGMRLAHAMPANTSGDFTALLGSDGFVELPPGADGAGQGSVARFYPWAA